VKLRTIPTNTLTGVCALLQPYAPDLSPSGLVAALKAHDEDGRATGARTPQMLSLKEAAAALNVSRDTVLRMVGRKRIGASKIGRQWRVPLTEIQVLAEGGE